MKPAKPSRIRTFLAGSRHARFLLAFIIIALVATAVCIRTFRVKASSVPASADSSAKIRWASPSFGGLMSNSRISGPLAAYLAPTPALGTCNTAGPIEIESSGGTVAPTAYGTLGAAVTAINGGTHTGTINIEVCGNTTEAAASISLSASGTGSASYTAINMTPVGGLARTITGPGTAGSPMIDLNGADNVTIDGLNTGGNSLTISNTNTSATSGTSTIRFQTDATNNTITNASILGSATMAVGTNGGNISFASAAVTTGNDNNTISNCNLGPAGLNLPSKAIHFSGTSNTDPGTANSGIVINNNNIFDYFSATVASAGIDVNSGTTNISITNNRFYQTATRTQTTTNTIHSGIRISNGSGSYTITGNTIGFGSNTGLGTYTLVLAASTARAFIPINLAVNNAPATSVQGNTIAGIAISGAASGTGNNAPFAGIFIGNGVTTIGDLTGNTIGSASATGSITYTSSSSSTSDVNAMYNVANTGVSDWTVKNNTIGGITVANSSTGASNLYGIRINTTTTANSIVQSNTIGGTVANSLQSTSTATASQVIGIYSQQSNSTITSNTIRNLTAAGGTGAGTSSSLCGICFANTSVNNTVSQNTIHTLSNTAAAVATVLSGIVYNSSTGTNLIARNFLHSFNAASTTAILNGIFVNGGTATYQNNMIRLGVDASGSSITTPLAINGINESSGTDNFYFNSVYIGGSGVSITAPQNTFAFTSSVVTNTRAFQDNIFVNARSNATAGGKHYAIRVGGTTTAPTGLTLNYNDYLASGNGGVFGSYNGSDVTSFTAWKTTPLAAGNGPGLDANSFNSDPQFLTPSGTSATVDLHINPSVATVVEGNGLAIAGITDDFDGPSPTRASLTPTDIGADAGNFISSVIQFSSATYNVNENVGGGLATITLSRTQTGGAVSVTAATVAGGTATAGSDYTTTSTSVAFADGASSASFTIPIANDALFEGNETVFLALSSPTNAAVLGTPNTAVLTIVEDDTAPTISIGNVTVAEGGGNAVFTVTQSAVTGATTTFTYSTADVTATAGQDYTAATNVAGSITAGNTTTTISIPILQDALTEANETFTVTLSNPVNATIATGTGTGTITDDDPKQFRSALSGGVGNWNATATWQQSTDGGTNWVAATTTPTSADGPVQITTPDYVLIIAPVTIDEVTIQQSAQLRVNPTVTVTVNDGSGNDIFAERTGLSDGMLRLDGTLTNGGQVLINGTLDMQGGSISAAPTYGSASTLKYSSPTTRGNEWTPGATSGTGYPANVQSINDFFLAGGAPNQPYQMSGTLYAFGSNFDFNGTTQPLTVLGDVYSGTVKLSTQPGGDLIVGGNLSGTVTSNGRTIFFNGTSQTIDGSTYGATSLGGITINSGSTVSVTGSVSISGDWTNNGAMSAAGGSAVTFNGTNNTQTISGTNTFVDLTISHSGTGTVTAAGSTLSVTGTLTVSSGTFTSATQYHHVEINNGGTLALSGAVSVNGNWTLNSGGTFTHNSNGVTFNGSSAQTIGGTSSTAFAALTISNSSGVTMTTSGSVAGTLTLNNDLTVDTGNTLTATGSTSSGTGDVIGSVARSDVGSTARAFGNPNNQISINSGTITSATMNLDKGETPTDFPQSVLRNYTITPGAGSLTQATVRLHYLDSELNSNIEDATLHLWRNSGTWTDVGQSNADFTNNWVEYNNVTGFSPWTISGPNAATAVKLTKFNANNYSDGVQLSWESGFEVNNLGYHIYRELNGVRTRVTPAVVAGSALKVGGNGRMASGFSYSWFDAQGTASAVYYLEAIDLNGQREIVGPILPYSISGVGPRGIRKGAMLLNEVARADDGGVATVNAAGVSDRPAAMKATAATSTANVSLANLSSQQAIAAGRAVKIPVSRTGWYRVTQPQLLAAGLDANSDARRLQLFVDGEELPILVNGDQSRLGKNDSIEFYGLALDTPTTNTHVYWLVNGATPGKRLNGGKFIKLKPGGAFPGNGFSAETGFAMTVERKDKLVYFSGLLNGDGENIFGPPVTSDPLAQILTVRNLDREGPGSAQVAVTLQGLTAGEHVVQVQLNGSSLGAISFNGLSHPVQTFPVNRALLREGDNTILLTSTNGEADVSLVDSVALTYGHLYRADNDSLRFSASAGQPIVVGGFSSPDIRVIDVTNPNSPNELGAQVGPQGGGYAFKLQATGVGTRTFVAFRDGLEEQSSQVTANQPSTLSTTRSADMLIVTHRNFRAAVEPLAAQRRSEGLQVAVVDIEDVYDEFSFGAHTPNALRDFIGWVGSHWQRAPHYLLLAGDSSWDPRNYLDQGEGDFVPTKLIDTAYLETASDDWLADFNNDGVADIAVGRLPGRTALEVERMVSKILLYERERQLGTPLRGALMVADTGFEAKSQATAGLLPAGLPVQSINRSQVGSDDVMRGQIVNGIDSGPMIVNYYGHGSVTVWTGAGLLDSELAAGLTNSNRPSLFVMMTCLNGYAHDAYIDSLAESLLKSEHGGAMAVWASSGFTEPEPQFAMNQQFYQQLFTGGMRLGDAARAAKAATGNSDVRRTWMLLGDPTMRMR